MNWETGMRSLFGWRRRRSTPNRRGRATLAIEILEDRCQPATTVAPDLLTQWDTGVSAYDNVTRDSQPVFAGTTTSPLGTKMWLFVDGSTAASTSIVHAGGGPFSLAPSIAIADGIHTAQFYDSKTHALSNSLTFTVDTAPPAPPAAPILLAA